MLDSAHRGVRAHVRPLVEELCVDLQRCPVDEPGNVEDLEDTVALRSVSVFTGPGAGSDDAADVGRPVERHRAAVERRLR
ncbi:hypothetical protein [Rhodococcus jostii]|uniref:hypothetical protein n=1 Tax=Rhodococcus jostii TaxID=132919 RepID=UPI003634CE2C